MKTSIPILTILSILIICLLPSLVHAQAPGFGDPSDDAPIDGGLSLLVAAGVGYGVKRMRKGSKEKL